MSEKKAKTEYDINYARQNIKRVPLDMQKKKYDELKAAADLCGERVNEYIKKAIAQRMEREAVPGVNPISPPAGESQDG